MEHNQPKVGIGVMIVKHRSVLLGKRKGSHGEGEYAFLDTTCMSVCWRIGKAARLRCWSRRRQDPGNGTISRICRNPCLRCLGSEWRAIRRAGITTHGIVGELAYDDALGAGYSPRGDEAIAMIARCTKARPISTLKALCDKGWAFARAAAAARAASAGDGGWSSSTASPAGLRQGTGATPPSTSRAWRMRPAPRVYPTA